ncbi:MAG: glucose 1-dehydrogenase [Anaerolineaceae bacterium]
MDFKSKVVLVTGAGKGIGFATIEKFAELGAHPVIVDSNYQNGKIAQSILLERGYDSLLCVCDVKDGSQIRTTLEQVEHKWGDLDVLVNNAGVYIQGNLTETSEEDWDRLISINLTGAFLFSKYAIPLMMRHGGVIVNVASEAGLVGIKGQVAYNVSKAGIIGLTKSCAVDFAEFGIRVNSVCPGTTDTPLVQAAISKSSDPVEARRLLESVRPLNRLGRPEEIASAVVYLASDDAAYATGSILSIDGGYTAQ